MSKDFRTSQIETSKLIASGGIPGTSAGLVIYSGSIATDRAGAVSDAVIFNDVGTDVFLFVSGSKSNSDFNRSQVSLFGGDVVISGTLYAERQVIEVDGLVDGDMFVTGNLLLKPDSNSLETFVVRNASNTKHFTVDTSNALIAITGSNVEIAYSNLTLGPDNLGGDVTLHSANVYLMGQNSDPTSIQNNNSQQSINFYPDTGAPLTLGGNSTNIFLGGPNEKFGRVEIQALETMIKSQGGQIGIHVTASDSGVFTPSRVYIASGTLSSKADPDPKNFTDTIFYVSGSVGSKNSTVLGTSVFGGDVVISGSLYDGSGNVIYSENSPSVFTSGLSGSLTQLADGSSYLIAGSNITITSESNGSITISSTESQNVFSTISVSGQSNVEADSTSDTLTLEAGSGIIITTTPDADTITFASVPVTGTFHVPTPSTMVTTSSVSFSGGEGFNYDPANIGIDTHFFVSGSIGSKDTAVVGTSVFGGDVVISGSLYDASGNIIYGSSSPSVFTNGLSGSLTQLSDGSSYLIAGSNITITSASNGAITISAQDDDTLYTAGTGILLDDAGEFSINNSVVATLTGSQFSGNIGVTGSIEATSFFSGSMFKAPVLSGSLTQLHDGSSYLIAGSNITITSASNGAVTISSSDTGISSVVEDTTPELGGNLDVNSFIVQGYSGKLILDYVEGDNADSIALASSSSLYFFLDSNNNASGQYFGIYNNKHYNSDDPTLADSIFSVSEEGNVKTLGYVTASMGFSGSLTQLTDGTSYLIAGTNVTINSASNGAITISSSDTGISNVVEDTTPELGGDLNVSSYLITGSSSTIYLNHQADGGDTGFGVTSKNNVYFFLDPDDLDAGSPKNFALFNNVGQNERPIADAIFRVSESGNVFTKGHITASMGFSGSLTQLTDGTSYLIAGSNITIISASNGAITISSAAGGGSDVDWSDGGDKLFTTSSVSIDADGSYVESHGSDVFFFVSGSTMSKGTTGTSVFGGDLVVSGAIYTGRIVGEADNTSFIDLSENNIEINANHAISIHDAMPSEFQDTNFFVSGSIGSKGNSSIRGVSTFGGDVYTSGSAYFGSTSIFEGGIHEIYSGSSNPTGVFVHDCDNGHLFYHDSLSTNFTANFTNLSLNQSHATTLTLVLSQSATAYIPNAVQIGGAAQTIDWQGNAEPSGTSNGKDVVSFTIVNVAGSYIVLGQLVDFG